MTTGARSRAQHFGIPACEATTHEATHHKIKSCADTSVALLWDMVEAMKEANPPASTDLAARFLAVTKQLEETHKKIMQLVHVGLHTSDAKQSSLQTLAYSNTTDGPKLPWIGIYATYTTDTIRPPPPPPPAAPAFAAPAAAAASAPAPSVVVAAAAASAPAPSVVSAAAAASAPASSVVSAAASVESAVMTPILPLPPVSAAPPPAIPSIHARAAVSAVPAVRPVG